jgi:hypothetical protein
MFQNQFVHSEHTWTALEINPGLLDMLKPANIQLKFDSVDSKAGKI